MKTHTLLKSYTLLLDMVIVSMLVLSISFSITDYSIANSHISRSGLTRTTFICWQSLFLVASFCVFLRYIARNVK